MKELKFKNTNQKVREIRKLIQSSGNKLFSIHFIARGTGQKRKMVCRKNVFNPQYASIPNGKKAYDPKKYNLLTVFDVNTLKYNRRDRLSGRGGWKSIPLDSVTRIKTNGEIYRII